ncbi:hypothetical protein MOQ_003357 [Trypanosoma cruzi marinkellei]|uniref:Uncharacterized protein n=1 Tax=Trypanosoma cruzi marinkellei TaxID=85056 RepID=K2ND16_TRYCR|nr:hypothetical protein MOQ_003357 [Trypanosoma cruzi marinkellei]
MDSFADGILGEENGEEGCGTPISASVGGGAVGFAEPSFRTEELSEDEDEAVATARNMELKLSAMRQVTLTGTAGDAEHMAEDQTPSQAAVASQACEPSSLVMASQRVSPDDIFRRHSKHVFILTSAGKPVFTRHGDEEEFTELFGIFRVLMAMAQQRHGDAAAVRQRQKENLHCITAGDLYLYFCVHGELFYVLVTRANESMRSCMRQLRQIHLQLVSLVPNVSGILSRHPSYDLRRLISSTDASVIRQLIRRNGQEECYLFRCLAAAPLSMRRRRSLEFLLAQHHGTAFPVTNSAGSGEENSTANTGHRAMTKEAEAKDHLYSFLFFRGRVVCAVGQADSDAPLHVDDALLLLNFTRCLANSQAGEIWAPVCLPMYNNTGYLWCYCANMNVMARDSRRGRAGPNSFDDVENLARVQGGLQGRITGGHETEENVRNQTYSGNRVKRNMGAFDISLDETPEAFLKSEGLLLVHIAASQEAFAALAEQTYRVASHLMSEIVQLEEELSRHESIALSLVTSEARVKKQAQQQRQLICETTPPLAAHADSNNVKSNFFLTPFIHPDGLQWFAAVLRGKPHKGGFSTLVYSEPSPAMRFSAHERKRLLRLVVDQRERLVQCSCLAEPLVLMRMNDVNLLLMRTTSTFVVSLVEQFFKTRTDISSPSSVASAGDGDDFITSQEALVASSRVKELMLLFSPHVSNPQMLRCALRVLVRLAAREGELSFSQLRGVRR